jgi:hypothetical protein
MGKFDKMMRKELYLIAGMTGAVKVVSGGFC